MLKSLLVAPLRLSFRLTAPLRESTRRLLAHAQLAADITPPLPSSVVTLGRIHVFGTAEIHFGPDILLYPDCHLETQSPAAIHLGPGAVLSRGVHLVAMAGITVGEGSMIGEYSSLRDANHTRAEGRSLRASPHIARPIHIGKQVWIGRGVTVLGGVTIGDHATVGANAVVTRDVPAHAVVAGVPARQLKTGRTTVKTP